MTVPSNPSETSRGICVIARSVIRVKGNRLSHATEVKERWSNARIVPGGRVAW